jgi:hypothetical protein
MPNAVLKKGVKDASRKLAREKLKSLLIPYLKDARAVDFILDLFETMDELIETSVEKGGVPGREDVARFLISRASTNFKMLGPEQAMACVGAVVDLGVQTQGVPGVCLRGCCRPDDTSGVYSLRRPSSRRRVLLGLARR